MPKIPDLNLGSLKKVELGKHKAISLVTFEEKPLGGECFFGVVVYIPSSLTPNAYSCYGVIAPITHEQRIEIIEALGGVYVTEREVA